MAMAYGALEQAVGQDGEVPFPLPPGTPPVLYLPCAVAIDSLYEHGMEGLDDVGAAIANGWQDVEDLGSAVGDLASGAWEGLFG